MLSINLKNMPRRLALLFISGCAFLSIGTMFYIFIRNCNALFLEPFKDLALCSTELPLFGFDWLPTFLHTIAFSLLTLLFVENNFKTKFLVFCSWCLINLFFEFAQLFDLKINEEVIGRLPIFLQYVFNGTFSQQDMLATISASALLIAIFYIKEQTNE